MSTGFFHQCLKDFRYIVEHSHPPEGMGYTEGIMDVRYRRPPLRQVAMLWTHLRACMAIRPEVRSGRDWFLREASTLPLYLGMILTGVPGRRLVLLVHHNYQWASTGFMERIAFRGLIRRGVRLLFLEAVPPAGPLLKGAVCASVSFPLTDRMEHRVSADHDAGLIGRWKRSGIPFVRQLLDIPGVDRLLVGASNIADAERDLEAFADRITFRDTREQAAFDLAFQSCRVVVLGYERDLYAYRASGLVMDAVRNQVPVVVPDFPVFCRQISWPEKVGEVYGKSLGVQEAVKRAMAGIESGVYGFDAHAEKRSISSVSTELSRVWGEWT